LRKRVKRKSLEYTQAEQRPSWTVSRLAGFLGLVLFGCSSPRQPRLPEPGEPTLKVLSYNLNFGMAGDAETIDVIRDADADLVVLQETTPEWELALSDELGARYPHRLFRHCCRAGGLAVLSKLPLSERDYVLSKAGWFPAWRLIVDSPLGPVQLLNVHLRPQVSDSGSVVSGYFSTPPIRAQEIKEYHATLESGLPTLVAGDFNENESGRAVTYLRQRGFRSVVPEFAPGADTWRWHTSFGTVHAELDHIAYDARLEPLNAAVIVGGRSDHYPLIASFRIAPPRAANPVQAGRPCSPSSTC